MDSFDYTICQFLLYEEKGDIAQDDKKVILCNPEALIHLFEKKLVVHKLNPKFVANSLERMQKYIKKGFSACNGTIMDLIYGVRKATEKDIKDNFEFYADGSTRILRFD